MAPDHHHHRFIYLLGRFLHTSPGLGLKDPFGILRIRSFQEDVRKVFRVGTDSVRDEFSESGCLATRESLEYVPDGIEQAAVVIRDHPPDHHPLAVEWRLRPDGRWTLSAHLAF
jgi:hypothetical protein